MQHYSATQFWHWRIPTHCQHQSVLFEDNTFLFALRHVSEADRARLLGVDVGRGSVPTNLLVSCMTCTVLVSDCHDPYHKSHKNWGLMFNTYQVQCIISTLCRVCVSCVSIPKMNRGLNNHCPYPAMQNILEWILCIMLELRKWFYVLINTDVLFVNPQSSYIVHI